MPSRPFCYTFKPPTSPVCKLVARPICHGYGCIPSPLDKPERLPFPPFSLVGRCLQKVRQEQSTLIVIALVWPAQVWYPLLLELLVQHPVLLPSHRYLLRDPFGKLQMMGQLQLAAWKVSGITTWQTEFQAGLPDSSLLDGAKAQTLPTNQLGKNGLAGVLNNIFM